MVFWVLWDSESVVDFYLVSCRAFFVALGSNKTLQSLLKHVHSCFWHIKVKGDESIFCSKMKNDAVMIKRK